MQWCTDPKVIAREVIHFYSNLFSSSNTCQPKLAMAAIETIVTEDMNRQLVADFKECGIHEALNQMTPHEVTRSRWHAATLLPALLGFGG